MVNRRTRRVFASGWTALTKTAMVAALLTATAILPGCGRSSDQVPLVAVKGTVTVEGKPLERGTINFIPTFNGPVSHGEITEGKYTLSTYGHNDGAAIGDFKVAVISEEKPPPGAPGGEPKPGEPDPALLLFEPKPLIPTHYFSPERSGLRATTVQGQENIIDFELSGKELPRPGVGQRREF